MNSALLGSMAALAWGTHDFLARFPSRQIGPTHSVLGVTVAEWVALRELYDSGEVPPSELAERLDAWADANLASVDHGDTDAACRQLVRIRRGEVLPIDDGVPAHRERRAFC